MAISIKLFISNATHRKSYKKQKINTFYVMVRQQKEAVLADINFFSCRKGFVIFPLYFQGLFLSVRCTLGTLCNKYMSHLISLTLSKALQVSYVELKAFGHLKISLLFQKKEVAYMMVNPIHSHFLQYSCWDVYVLLHKA